MEGVLAIGLKIKTIEECLIVAFVVKGGKLRRIQKSPGSQAIHGQEVAHPRGSVAQTDTAARGAKIAVGCIDISKKPPRSETLASRHGRDQAALVAKLRTRRTRGGLHALDRTCRKLGRE